MEFKEVLREENCFVNIEADNKEEAIKFLANKLYSKGFVKSEFEEKVLEREVVFPTGLPIEGKHKVAIPHTDSEYVNENTLAIATLKEPVDFYCMADNNVTVKVSLIIMMAIKDKEQQVPTLMELIQLVQDEKLINTIMEAKDSKQVYNAAIRRTLINQYV